MPLEPEIVANDLTAVLAGEVGRFEVTLQDGVRFVITMCPGDSLEHILPLLDEPGARPFRVRKLLNEAAAKTGEPSLRVVPL